ncbi:EpsG family protein [Coprobacillaceae bacterium CR2/5/TPMF4]|nr:EpsG family protein [Coprobacillaceae bacterium CR2/5/TPMF4]
MSFVLWVLIASTFHPYSLMYLIIPFLNFEPWSGKTYLFLIIFLIIGLSLQPLLGTVVDITTMLGEEYDATTFTGEGINIFRLAVVWVPVVISFLREDI